MPRIQPVDERTTDPNTADLLANVKRKIGRVPNIIATMANSSVVARAYLGFSQALSEGALSGRLREQIALVVGHANRCDYCLAAHTALGKRAGLSDKDTCAARQAQSDDERERRALVFAQKLVQDRGVVQDADVERLRAGGYNDGEISEIIAHVALNLFTNYFNHVAQTEIDFPVAAGECAA